jgi:hypothetical protein
MNEEFSEECQHSDTSVSLLTKARKKSGHHPVNSENPVILSNK